MIDVHNYFGHMVFVSLLGVKSEDLSATKLNPQGPWRFGRRKHQFLLIEENLWVWVQKVLWAFSLSRCRCHTEGDETLKSIVQPLRVQRYTLAMWPLKLGHKCTYFEMVSILVIIYAKANCTWNKFNWYIYIYIYLKISVLTRGHNVALIASLFLSEFPCACHFSTISMYIPLLDTVHGSYSILVWCIERQHPWILQRKPYSVKQLEIMTLMKIVKMWKC